MTSTSTGEQPAFLTCPACGNVNPYAADRCLKCELQLAPIRVALELARSGSVQADAKSAPKAEPQKETELEKIIKQSIPDMTRRRRTRLQT